MFKTFRLWVLSPLLAVIINFSFIPLANAELLGTKISAVVGTLGVGAEFSIEALETFTIRASVQGGEFGYKMKASGTDYDAKLRLLSAGVQADFLPFGTGIFVSSGVFYNMNKLQLNSSTVQQVNYNGNSYNMTIASKSDVTFNKISPYVGGGFKLGFLGVADVAIEAGLLSHGVPTLTTQLTQTNDAPSNITNNLTIPTAVSSDIINNARTSVENFTLYPVIKIAVSIKF